MNPLLESPRTIEHQSADIAAPPDRFGFGEGGHGIRA
jgi:hypothetical protein